MVLIRPGAVQIFPTLPTHFPCARVSSRYLSAYYSEEVEVPKRALDGYENAPTLVGMTDVFINELGYVWNGKARTLGKE